MGLLLADLRASFPVTRHRFSHRHAIRVRRVEHRFVASGVGKRERAQTARLKAHPLFVGPHRGFERAYGVDSRALDSLQRLQRGQHTEDAVEAPAARLGIQMGAADDGGCIGVPPFAAREQVADRINRASETGLACPVAEEPAGLGVEVGQGGPVASALGSGADLRHRHVTVPKSALLDTGRSPSIECHLDLSPGLTRAETRALDDMRSPTMAVNRATVSVHPETAVLAVSGVGPGKRGWMQYIHVLHPSGALSRVKIRSYAFFPVPPEINGLRRRFRWHILVPKASARPFWTDTS